MNNKQTYLFLFAMGLVLVFIGKFMHIGMINHIVNPTWTWMQNPLIFGPAAICAFIFINNKKYWLINTGVALIASIAIQYLVVKTGDSLFILFIRVLAFLAIVYLLNLIKIILDK